MTTGNGLSYNMDVPPGFGEQGDIAVALSSGEDSIGYSDLNFAFLVLVQKRRSPVLTFGWGNAAIYAYSAAILHIAERGHLAAVLDLANEINPDVRTQVFKHLDLKDPSKEDDPWK